MKIVPAETFHAYPDGKKTLFRAGVETTVTKAFGDMLKAKGLLAGKHVSYDVREWEESTSTVKLTPPVSITQPGKSPSNPDD